MSENYDVIIVGAGSMGMSAGYQLARDGVKVLMIDAYDPPHIYGSHAGETRLIRHAYGEGLEYVPLLLRAQELWDHLQAQTSENIFVQTGVLSFGAPDSDFVRLATEAAREYPELEAEELTGQEINERWEGFNVPDETVSVFEPKAGSLFSENIIRAYRERAIHFGAELKVNEPVLDIQVNDDQSVTVKTPFEEYTGDKLIMTAGAYMNKLLPKLDVHIKLQPNRRAVGWFKAEERIYSGDVFPGFFGDYPGQKYYGFPSFHGTGVKVGNFDSSGVDTEPEYTDRIYGTYADDEGGSRQFLEDYLPQAAGPVNTGTVCLFNNTPDEHFVIDFHPNHKNIVIAGGFSGHGFKFVSVVGEILKELVTKGETEFDLNLFRIDRPIIQKEQ